MGVEFNEGNMNMNVQEESKGLTAWIIAHGWAKDEASAKKLQVVASIIFFALAIYIAF